MNYPHRILYSWSLSMRNLVLVLIIGFGAVQYQFAKNTCAETINKRSSLSHAVSVIASDDLKRHVDILADDTFEGRAAGTRGGRAAAGYLRKQLISMGLDPAGINGSYSQPFRNDCQNLLAVIPGYDETLLDEFILIGAHYDHVGYGSRKNSYGPTGYIHNGADDNASGTSALLEIAEALKVNPCRRSVLIAFWDGEEQGLWGSKYFIANPTIPLNQLKLALNMDMVGRLRDNTLTMYGARTWSGSRSLIATVNTHLIDNPPLKIEFDWEIKENSDHHPFFKTGIPYLMPHTGLHDDYHRPRDDAHKINASGIESVARFTYQTVLEIDQLDSFPSFREMSRRETPRAKRRFENPLAPPPKRLGLNWASEQASENGLQVTRIERRSPARDAGIKRGDRIIKFNGDTITNDDEMRSAVFGAPGNSQITIISPGSGDEKTLDVVLRGKPMRLGVSWRHDHGNPDTPMISRVIPGSPAELAGLRYTDRIHTINGASWKDSDGTGNPFDGVPFPIDIQYERNGRLYFTTLVLPEAEAKINSDDA